MHPPWTGMHRCLRPRRRLHPHPRSELHRRLDPRRPRRLYVHRVHPLRTVIHRRLLCLQGQPRLAPEHAKKMIQICLLP